jgi:hypothetical protein
VGLDPGTSGNFVSSGLLALRRSGDGGISWETRISGSQTFELGSLILSNPISSVDFEQDECPIVANRFGQGWYDNVLAVDPLDPDIVWAGGVDLFRSDDGGRNWGLASYWWEDHALGPFAHGDQHVLVFHPQYDGATNSTLFASNDGGLFISNNARAPTSTFVCSSSGNPLNWDSLNNGYGVTQFYHGSVFPGGRRYLGGTQDNGTNMGNDDGGSDQWVHVFGGDGAWSAIDPGNPDTFYVSRQFGRIARTRDGGVNFENISPSSELGLGNFTFITPLVMDPGDSSVLWTGAHRLARSSNQGQSWEPASTVLAPGEDQRVTAMAVSPFDPKLVIAGTTDGVIAVSNTALQATGTTPWTITQPASGWISSVRFDPLDPATVYATYSTFGVEHVWRSRDAGMNWQSIDGLEGLSGLPDLPVHDIVVDPRDSLRLFLATDLGLYVSVDGGNSWAPDPFAASGADRKSVV